MDNFNITQELKEKLINGMNDMNYIDALYEMVESYDDLLAMNFAYLNNKMDCSFMYGDIIENVIENHYL